MVFIGSFSIGVRIHWNHCSPVLQTTSIGKNLFYEGHESTDRPTLALSIAANFVRFLSNEQHNTVCMKWTLLIMMLLPACCFAQKLPYQDAALSSEQRAKDLISRLTLQEKAL